MSNEPVNNEHVDLRHAHPRSGAVIDLVAPAPVSAAPARQRDAAATWEAMTRAIAGLDGPVAAINLSALRYNAHDLLLRAAGTPIRVASKSIRIRAVADAVLALPGYAGVLAFTLPEALWLAEHGCTDVVLGYPTANRGAIASLLADPQAAQRIRCDRVDRGLGAGSDGKAGADVERRIQSAVGIDTR